MTTSPSRLFLQAVAIAIAMAVAAVAWTYLVRPQTPPYVLSVVFLAFLGFGIAAGLLIYWNAKLSQRQSSTQSNVDSAKSNGSAT